MHVDRAVEGFEVAFGNLEQELFAGLDAPGRPRKRPTKLHGDKGYDYPRCRKALRARGITPRIARRGIESSQRLGRHRYVVERSLAWLVGYRRLQVRYERRADILLGFVHLACALICLHH